MIARQFDPIAELQSAFTLLTRNYSIATIPLVALIVCFALIATVIGVAGGGAILASMNDLSSNPMALVPIITASLAWFGIAGLLAFIVWLIANGAAVAASESAWQSGTADVGGGFNRALSRLPDLILAAIVLGVICIAIAWTIVGGLALLFFMLYVIPAIVVGGESAFQAMGTSWNMSTKNAGATFAALLGIIIVAIVAMIVNAILSHIPVLGWIISLLINALLSTYAALVVVRFYDLLRGSATATAPPAPPATPTS